MGRQELEKNMARVLVPLAEGCEELEAITVIDLLRRAEVEVISAGLAAEPVTCSRGVVIMPDTTLEKVLDDRFDMIVLPGGLPGADYLDKDSRIHRLLQKTQQQGGYIAAICAAPRVLANAGLLTDKQVTSYPGVVDIMDLPGTQYIDQAVVTDGNIITSRGPGTAMDFALELIEKLQGKEQRMSVEMALVR
jgi:4-methyl-5(b-hydroxyethyl)-thiazole monophosphate biosynthesis